MNYDFQWRLTVRTMTGLKQLTLVLLGFGMATAMSVPVAAQVFTQVPEAVSKTFQANFPDGKITTVHLRVDDGVTMYDAHFTDANTTKVVSIAADGTMLESGPILAAKEVPDAVSKAILKAAAGATIVEIEKLTVTNDTENGKVIKLAAPQTEYQAVLAKLGSLGYVTVDPNGNVIEPVTWEKM